MLALATATADAPLMIDTHLTYALALNQVREDAAAREHALFARDLARSEGDHKREAKALFDLAIISGNVGDLATAYDLGEEALQIYRTIGDRSRESLTLGNLGFVLAKMGNYAAATQHFEQHLLMSYEIGWPKGN